jgi:hypothetical protein
VIVTLGYTLRMHLNRDQAAALKRVQRATRELESAERKARESVTAALALGCPQSRVASAAGLSRMALWRRSQKGASAT